MAGHDAPRRVRIELDLPLGARRWQAALEVGTGPMAPQALWPLFAAIDDAVVQWSAEDAAAAGQPLSCRSGCAACCRHLVPVSALELRVLLEAAAALPPAVQQGVAARLARAVAALQASGLQQRLMQFDALDRDALVALIDDYFARQIDCPFLADEACTVYAQRPLACREHGATTPAAACQPAPAPSNARPCRRRCPAVPCGPSTGPRSRRHAAGCR